jgi:hypothetical protein
MTFKFDNDFDGSKVAKFCEKMLLERLPERSEDIAYFFDLLDSEDFLGIDIEADEAGIAFEEMLINQFNYFMEANPR